jgi:G3E family GTPase
VNVDAMLRSMSAKQWGEWVAFGELEPFEPERLEQVVSQVTQVLINQNRSRGTKAISNDDIRLRFGDDAAQVPGSVVAQRKSSATLEAVARAMVITSRKALNKKKRVKR